MARRLSCCEKVPFYHDCECQCNGTMGVEDIFEEVMVRAREAELYYCCLVEHAQCEVDKEMFRRFSLDERRHYALLQQILRELTCQCFCVGEVCIEEPQGFCRAIKVAIYNEMQMSNDYENLACYLCDMQQREVLLSMIQDSRCHAERLAELYKFAQDCACRNVAGTETDNCCNCCNNCCNCCCGNSCGCGCNNNGCCGCNNNNNNNNCWGGNNNGNCCCCGCIPICLNCCNCNAAEAEEEEDEDDCCITWCCMDDDTCPCVCGHKNIRKISDTNPAEDCCAKRRRKHRHEMADSECKKCNCRSVQSGSWGY